MRPIQISFLLVFLPALTMGQLTMPPNGGNKKASVTERIGITDVTIQYDRPGVKGREGKIWGDLVTYGYSDPGFGTSKSAPWRAGANECTRISFTTDVKVEGKLLPAGTYALFMVVQPNEATIIFNRNFHAWGSYFYDPKMDVLSVPVRTRTLDRSVERLTYEFTEQGENSAMIALSWEKKQIPFRVEVDMVETQLASFRNELTGDIGFTPEPWSRAAVYCADLKTNLPEALQWADYAISGPFVGKKNYQTLGAKARVLEAMGRDAEAQVIRKESLNYGSEEELHLYARQLLQSGKTSEAIPVFEMNARKHPNTFITNMGMARAHSAKGAYKKALKFAETALPQAPDDLNRENVQKMIGELKKGKDINQPSQ